ncbi:PB1 domain-containing protein [Artemisia annua]|uniref:PB1 domain-containing protein n=1 Tax=Artemisia annua TaxID=35608 RepID=A0A2U1Q6F9_ARTAN|nr:PB1 domain-containing protein [Artemisia annua]
MPHVEDLYAAAHAPKLEAFENCTEDIKSISPEAYNWAIRSEPGHWANTFFGGLRVESSQCITLLTPSMEDKLKNEVNKARSVQVLRSHGSKFEVRYGETVDVVGIENWDCSCKGWLLTGLPCCHVIAVLESYGRSPYDHCSRYFHVETYQLTYADSIHPIPNVERLVDSEAEDGTVLVTPPPTMRTPGRTKIRKVVPGGRIGPSDFLKRQLQCGKCKGLGHNKRSCK